MEPESTRRAIGIEYSDDRTVTAAQLADVFRRSGIRRPVDDVHRIEKMLTAADLIVSAWRGSQLVGVARALTDFCFCCYLSDLAVDKSLQRQGIGRELLRRVGQKLGDQVMILLLAAPEAQSYYPRVGYEPVTNGWIIQRNR